MRGVNFENFLLLDASTPLSVFAGMTGKDGRVWKNFAEEKSDALDGVFSAAKKVCGNAFESARGFLFCEGPGSILGIRIAAAAIRAWLALDAAAGKTPRPVFAFQSLPLAAALVARAFPSEKNFTVVAESRMRRYNIFSVVNGVPAKSFCEIDAAELSENLCRKIFTLPGKRAFPPELANAMPISPAALLAADPAVFSEMPQLLRDCGNAPDAVNTSDANSYARWTPSRHRA